MMNTALLRNDPDDDGYRREDDGPRIWLTPLRRPTLTPTSEPAWCECCDAELRVGTDGVHDEGWCCSQAAHVAGECGGLRQDCPECRDEATQEAFEDGDRDGWFPLW